MRDALKLISYASRITPYSSLSDMLLAIDIGNTSTKFGFFENDTLIERINIPTNRHQTADEIYNSSFNKPIRAVVVSSVVPELRNSYLELSEKYFNVVPVFVENSFNFKLKIKYNSPENLGVDRLVAAFAAVEKYGKPSVVCDFGTATTIDAVNSRGEFLGGIIAPGMNLLSEALFLKTSKLPRVEIVKPETVIGDSTVKAIQAGIYFGYNGLVDGIIKRMIDELDDSPRVVATGGFARIIAEASGQIEIVDDDLMLEGLRLIYKKHF